MRAGSPTRPFLKRHVHGDGGKLREDRGRSPHNHLDRFDIRWWNGPIEWILRAGSPCPRSVYSSSKLAAEKATLSDSSHAVVRVALLYGESPSQSKGFLGWMKRTFAEEKSLPLFEDEFRTPIHVLDAARAAFQIARSKARGIWHCGGPERLSRVQFGITVARAYGFDEMLILPTTRLSHTSLPPRPEDVSLKSQALWREIQFTPKPVEEALREYEVGSRYSL